MSSPDLIGSKTFDAADQIWRWNTDTSTWTKYSYYGGRGVFFWAKEGEDTEVLDTEVIPAGETFFFKRSSGATGTMTLTLAGGVKDLSGNSSFAVTKGQLAFASNPWPIAIKVKDFTQYYSADGADPVGSKTFDAADQIWLWNTATSTWTKYSYYGGRGVFYWAKEGEDTEVLDTEVIGAGVGFFFKRSSGASATEAAIIKFENK